jgi:hypothetical protein
VKAPASNGHYTTTILTPRGIYNRRGSNQMNGNGGVSGAVNPQWRSSVPHSQRTAAAENGVSSTPRPSHGVLTSRLAPDDGVKHSPTHSKRPVSPQAPPVVRRRLAKRSRQDIGSLHPNPDSSSPDDAGHVTDSVADTENVTVERLLGSSEARNVSRATGLSEASSIARDLHALPAISTTIVNGATPRHS